MSLSHVNDPERISVYPGDPPFELETVATLAREGYYLRAVRGAEHTGTHWGAPGHFTEGGRLADDLEPADLFRPAVKVDVRAACAADPDYAVTTGDLTAWEQRHGRIPDESVVIIWTGWEGRFGTPGFGRHPGFAPEAVRGGLSHHMVIREGRIANYHPYPPTTWNGSVRDSYGTPGPYEDAVQNTPIFEENPPESFKGIDIMRTVRSFDPCLPCGVHMYLGGGRVIQTQHAPMGAAVRW